MPRLPVLVLSMHDESVFAERVLRAGGRGYVSKEAGGDQLLEAIRCVLSGQIYVSAGVSTRLLDSLSGRHSARTVTPVEQLTDRELEVFTLIGQAKETKEIAHAAPHERQDSGSPSRRDQTQAQAQDRPRTYTSRCSVD